MNLKENYPSSFDNYPRPSKMKKPDISGISTGAATRFIGYIGDQLESILIDKYGKTRGEKTFEGLLDTGNNAIYTVCTNIIKEKIKMFQDLGIPDSEYMNKDYFDTSYYALWSKWMDEFVKKPYSHLIKKESKESEIQKVYITSMITPVSSFYLQKKGKLTTIKNPKEIEEYLKDSEHWTDDEIFLGVRRNWYVDDLIGKIVVLSNGTEILVTDKLNEKINKLKESIEKLSGKKVKLVESNISVDNIIQLVENRFFHGELGSFTIKGEEVKIFAVDGGESVVLNISQLKRGILKLQPEQLKIITTLKNNDEIPDTWFEVMENLVESATITTLNDYF